MFFESVVNFALICTALAFDPSEDLIRSIYTGDYPQDYDPDVMTGSDLDPERIAFDALYERRKNFDVESPMEFATDSKPEEIHDNQMQSSDPNEDKSGRPAEESPENSGNSAADDYASESQNNPKSMLTDGCLRCLCEASSDCDPQVRCHVEGPTSYNCGPFQININYWAEAGSPGVDQNDPLDFEECMNDIECSIDTVNGYMKKWAKDCDGDGRISCDDYAKIHKVGADQCNNTYIAGTAFYDKYKECFFEYR